MAFATMAKDVFIVLCTKRVAPEYIATYRNGLNGYNCQWKENEHEP